MKNDYCLPDYKGGGIVNLMSSIKKSYGGKHPYKELRLLPSKELKGTKNVVLIILDGLGYNFLKKNAKGTIFEENLVGSMTSVFPPTTATAVTTFLTGLPPQQSAFSGWYMNIKELGCVISTFRYAPRAGGEPFSKSGIDIKNVFDCKSFTQDLKVKSYLIKPSKITKSDLNIMIAGKSEMIGFNTLKGFFNKINKTVKSNNRKKYVYGYWHMFDKMAHKKGVGSREIKKHFLELSKEVSRLAKRLKGTNTKLIISADHGFVDCPKSKFIDLKDHPKMGECLTLPLCGDSRVKYCYVKPDKVKQFEKYVKTKLKKCCDCYTNKEIIEKGFYGLFKPNKKLYDRTGDYILIMKDKYTLKDYILGEEKMFKIGKHSGVSEDEMLVPLVVVDC
jgi:hypothetical protein